MAPVTDTAQVYKALATRVAWLKPLPVAESLPYCRVEGKSADPESARPPASHFTETSLDVQGCPQSHPGQHYTIGSLSCTRNSTCTRGTLKALRESALSLGN